VTGPVPSPLLAWQLLASGSDGLIAYDAELRCLFWNAAMEKISGMKAVDVVGQPLLQLFPFLVESGEDGNLRRALRGEEVSSPGRPFRIVSTGRRGFFDGHYRPLREEDGAVTGGIAVIRDVTDRREAEQQLQETETRFRNMADVSPVLLWMAETNGLCTFFNQTWLRFTGRTLEEEWGVSWAEGVHFEDFQRCMDTYIEAFNQRRVFEMEYRLRRADGEFRWVLDRGTPRYTPEGHFAGYIGSCVDITERKAAEAELRRAVQVRDQFLSVASHELRTPLTPLQLQIDRLDRLLQRQPRQAIDLEEVTEMAIMVKSQVARVAELVDVLLDVSRVAYGPLQLDWAEIDVAELVRETVDRWRPAASTAGCELDLRLDGPVLTMADRLRLEQLLNNLLSNAIKYGARKPVEVELASDEERLRLRVIDHGIGISLEDQARIFERFERAVPVENYGGLGLGLWISRQIVEAMGGAIRLDSVPEQGARFSVELPRRSPASSAGHSRRPPERVV
jgi:PAS domain S-box-containing protein